MAKRFQKALSVGLSLALCAGMVLPALAVTYDISLGGVAVTESGSTGWLEGATEATSSTERDITIVQSEEGSTSNTITVGEGVTGATITLDGVNIDVSGKGEAAMSIGANSNVTVELDGDNTLKSGQGHAGLELNRKNSDGEDVEGAGGSVTIQDKMKDDGNGNRVEVSEDDAKASLDATGGAYGAGIGTGGRGGVGGSITIDGADVTATGGDGSAGIGSGYAGRITGGIHINDSDGLTATGGAGDNGYAGGAGIGSGNQGTVKGGIEIKNSDGLTATGGDYTGKSHGGGAGIGSGGLSGKVYGDITIEDSDNLTATGGGWAAGIGTGANFCELYDGGIIIRRSDGLTATGGRQAAGIGGGWASNVGKSSTPDGKSYGIIIEDSNNLTATGGEYAAGIGSGQAYSSVYGGITIKNSNNLIVVGKKAAGIGSGYPVKDLETYNKIIGDIQLTNVTNLLVLGDGKWGVHAGHDSDNPDPKGQVKVSSDANNMGVLNVKLSDELLNGATQVNVQIFDAQGNAVQVPDGKGGLMKSIPMTDENGVVYEGLALMLPKGDYYVYVTTDQDPEGSVGVVDAEGNVLLERDVKADKMLSELLTASNMTYEVNFSFASGSDNALPENMPALPQGVSGGKLTVENVANGFTSNATYEDISVDGGGHWHFDGWETKYVKDGTLDNSGKLVLNVVGKWSFVPNTINPGTPGGGDFGGDYEIDDQAIPLAEGPVTRAQFIDYLWRHEGEPASAGVCTFADVTEEHEFFAALCWGEENGIAEAYFGAEGHEDGTFEPDELVTVAAVREFLGNFADVFGTNVVAVADLTTLTGEDDEAVLNCGEVVAEFFGEEYISAEDEDIEIAA